ncbi:MAG: CUAEP/CCAEP-tail radical SAM protein [Gammaproteobacteria bacterium]|nr:MAG: CUAEP/CCAEP-tail radical SAM protein [Gammaproteobacteria bacterium]
MRAPESRCHAAVDGAQLNIVLINPYELGRQPFGLAEPAAWLNEAGHHVTCLDLSLQRLDADILREAALIGIYVGMHTATRIAIEAMPHIRELAPGAHICVYGLYAPMNEALLRSMGAKSIFGGEVEPDLVALADGLSNGRECAQAVAVVNRAKVEFRVPDRSILPDLSRYAHLRLGGEITRTVGFAEGSRGCKHLCRHCPVVPVYEGKFRIVPVDVVMADIRQQVAVGAEHISFGDPDFLNGPTHALRLVRALHAEFPDITYDATIKIEHIINQHELLPLLKETGCLFITSAVEAVDDAVLQYLDKNHTSDDFNTAVESLRELDIACAPTFVPFTPWATLQGYIELLERLVSLRLVESVPPIQLAIRLLVPAGSYLLKIPGFLEMIDEYDEQLLGYPWRHPDASVDTLQRDIQALVEKAEQKEMERRELFALIWSLAHEALGHRSPPLPADLGETIPHMSEPWYCCAEPTSQQLQSF